MHETVQCSVPWMLQLLIYISEHKLKKRCLTIFFNASLVAVFDKQQRFFSLCSMMYVNNHSTYDVKNFTGNICYCSFSLFCCININIKYYSKVYGIIIMCCGKYLLGFCACLFAAVFCGYWCYACFVILFNIDAKTICIFNQNC